MNCRHDAQLGYRILTKRHDEDCANDLCGGCQPCETPHCVVCTRGHCDDTTPQTCAACVGVIREDLARVVEMHERLEDEACHTHADGRLNAGPLGGDAMVMLAEGRYLSAARRQPEEYRNDPVPPLLVLATWEDDWRIELGHGGGPRATLWRCADYLGTHLTMMAQRHLAFDEFAADVAKVRGRMEAVLHAGEQVETGAPCMAERNGRDCNTPLEKVYGRTVAFDHWKCPRCRTTYGAAEYGLAVTNDYRKHAPALPVEDIEVEYGVPAGTVRVWANRGKVAKRGKDSRGRQLYDVEDVLNARDGSAA